MAYTYGETKIVEVLLDMEEHISKRLINEKVQEITLPNEVDPDKEIERLKNEIADNVIRLAGIRIVMEPYKYQVRYSDDDDFY
jgi:hypothetical protein